MPNRSKTPTKHWRATNRCMFWAKTTCVHTEAKCSVISIKLCISGRTSFLMFCQELPCLCAQYSLNQSCQHQGDKHSILEFSVLNLSRMMIMAFPSGRCLVDPIAVFGKLFVTRRNTYFVLGYFGLTFFFVFCCSAADSFFLVWNYILSSWKSSHVILFDIIRTFPQRLNLNSVWKCPGLLIIERGAYLEEYLGGLGVESNLGGPEACLQRKNWKFTPNRALSCILHVQRSAPLSLRALNFATGDGLGDILKNRHFQDGLLATLNLQSGGTPLLDDIIIWNLRISYGRETLPHEIKI